MEGLHTIGGSLLSQVVNCIACLEDLGSMGWAAPIYMMVQHLVAKP